MDLGEDAEFLEAGENCTGEQESCRWTPPHPQPWAKEGPWGRARRGLRRLQALGDSCDLREGSTGHGNMFLFPPVLWLPGAEWTRHTVLPHSG